jgi:spermidine/putrescine transport system permease protein
MTTAATTRTAAKAADPAVSTQTQPPRWWRNPWRRPVFLESFTWLYLVWSLVPIVLAVLFSFNSGKSQAVWQGFSLRWYITDPVLSIAHSNVLQLAVLQTLKLSAYTTVIAVPLGVTFALGIHRWRTRTGATFNFVMLLSFVIPELIFGVAMFFVFTSLFSGIGLGTLAETLALVTWNVSWPAVIVQARLATIGNSYSEAAADLGCTPFQTLRRVMLPLLSPAIFASAILVFSTVIDDFVIVDLLSNSASNTPMSVYIYATQRGGNGGPALNALGTIMLIMSFVIAIGGYFGYRLMTRGERGTSVDALATIAGS